MADVRTRKIGGWTLVYGDVEDGLAPYLCRSPDLISFNQYTGEIEVSCGGVIQVSANAMACFISEAMDWAARMAAGR